MSAGDDNSRPIEWAESADIRAALDRAEALGRPAGLVRAVREMVDELEASIPAEPFAALGLERAARKAALTGREEIFERRKGPVIGHLLFRAWMLRRNIYPRLLDAAESIAEGGSAGYAKALADMTQAAHGLAHVVRHSDLRELVIGNEKLRGAGAEVQKHDPRDRWSDRVREVAQRNINLGTPGWDTLDSAAEKLRDRWGHGHLRHSGLESGRVRRLFAIKRALRPLYDPNPPRRGRPRKKK